MSQSFDQLIDIVKKLRGPNGCPWDKEQTHKSLTPYAIEEAYELEEAINNNDEEEGNHNGNGDDDKIADTPFMPLTKTNAPLRTDGSVAYAV